MPIYGLKEEGLLDDYFCFLERSGFLGFFEELVPERLERLMISFTYFLNQLKQLLGIRSLNAVPSLLSLRKGPLRLVGFNAHQMEHGLCERGQWKRKRTEPRRGPMCEDTLARNLVKLRGGQVSRFFRLSEQHIEFVVPARNNMTVTSDARALAATRGPGVYRQGQREPSARKPKRVLAGIEGLTRYDSYGPAGQLAREGRKDFEPQRIHAVVLLEEDGKRRAAEDQMVLLTNGAVDRPVPVFERYDMRSTIENSLFREEKQKWHLLHPLQKSRAGVQLHTFFTLAMVVLTAAYRQDRKRRDLDEERSDSFGIERFRRRLHEEKLDKPSCSWATPTESSGWPKSSCYAGFASRTARRGSVIERHSCANITFDCASLPLTATESYAYGSQVLAQGRVFSSPPQPRLKTRLTWGTSPGFLKLDKGIVFMGDTYGIFWLAEILLLRGIRVKDRPPGVGD